MQVPSYDDVHKAEKVVERVRREYQEALALMQISEKKYA